MPRSPTAGNRGNGGKWIRPEKRRRIYERDGWRCVWCNARVATDLTSPEIIELVMSGREDEVRLATLDHVRPRSQGGNNEAHNLITCCGTCNSMRRELPPIGMAGLLALQPYRGREPQRIRLGVVCAVLDRIVNAIKRPLP